MPRTPISYANTHVYKIVCRDLNSKYCCVGHTTDFKRRKSEHTKTCNSKTRNTHTQL